MLKMERGKRDFTSLSLNVRKLHHTGKGKLRNIQRLVFNIGTTHDCRRRFLRARKILKSAQRIRQSNPVMEFNRLLAALGVYILVLKCVIAAPNPEEPIFEIPVQLVGFPVIIAAVRVTNFVKKLAYSLNPETYVSRVRRSTDPRKINENFLDVSEVEKRLIKELGVNVCVYERICSRYASRSLSKRSGGEQVLDLDYIFSRYKVSPDPMKENYLLSVFLGDIVASPRLCHQLAKRGRACDENTLIE